MFARHRLATNTGLLRTADDAIRRTLFGAAMLLTVAFAGLWTAQFTRPSFAADPPKQIKDATSTKQAGVVAAADVVSSAGVDSPADLASLADHPVNQWIKRTPLADTPTSPRLGYEGACVWDSRRRLVVRYGGHNQGGGGEQGAEVWTFDPLTARWVLLEPNTSPPGVCCNAQNLYDPTTGRYIRFPYFSGSHGWQWQRELYLNDSSLWTYDLAANRWRNMRPYPAPRLAPYRAASWDTHHKLAVVFGGEGSNEGTVIYDPARNEWRFPKPSPQPEPRSGGNMAYDSARKLHILFGSQFSNDRHTWAYDVAANEWRDMQPPTMPPTDQNDAVLTYDPIHKLVLALVKVTTGEGDNARHEVQSWSYDAALNQWRGLAPKAEPDSAGNRTRNLIFAPELNLAILENCTSKPREQQIWTYRYAATTGPNGGAGGGAPGGVNNQAKPIVTTTAAPLTAELANAVPPPPLVDELVASVKSERQVELAWQAPPNADGLRYQVERAVVEVWSDDQLTRLKQCTPPLESPSVGAIRRIGPFQVVTGAPISERSFVDATVDLTQPKAIEGEPVYDRPLHSEQLDEAGRGYRRAVFAYRVRSVDGQGRVGGPSSTVFTIPSSPQFVFSREDGTTCRLKWQANPEQGIVGYRVYRMDGRYGKDPVSRLTDTPLTPTEFADTTAGKSSRRYYIIAVDALGQEGFTSSPVWFEREWKPFYEPFVGPWHQ